MLVALGFDRREAVVYPLQFARHRYQGAHLVSGAWLLSALLSSPILFLMQVVEVDCIRQCNIILSKLGWKIYVVYMLTFVIIIPTLLLISFYSQIVGTINKKYQQAASMERKLERDLQKNKIVESKPTLNINREALSTTTITTIEDVESSSDDEDDYQQAKSRRKTTRCNIINSLCSSKLNAKHSVDITITLDGSGNTWNNKVLNDDHDDKSNCNSIDPLAKDDEKVAGSASLNDNLDRISIKGQDHIHRHRARSEPLKPKGRRLTGALINRQHGKSIIPKARLKTIQMTIAIVIAFLVCWLPFYVVNIINVFNLIDQKNQYWDMMSYTNIFCYLNSAMNPILYFWFSRNKTKDKPDRSQQK